MQDILFSLNIVAPVFLVVALGYFLTRIKVWDGDFLKTANKLCFNVFLPIYLFYNIYISDFSKIFDIKLIFFIFVSVTVIFLFGIFVIPLFIKDRGRCAAIIQALFRGNYALLGVPICQSMFGDAGVAAAAVASAFVIPYFNILATILLSIYSRDNKTSVKNVVIKILKNPLLIGCVLGMLSALLKIKLPTAIESAMSNIKGLTTPLSLLVLGGDFKFREFASNIKPVIATTAARLLLVPGIVLAIAAYFGFSHESLGVLIAVYATPVAVSSYPMTRQMNGDYELAGQLVVSTTFCSMFTVFIFVYALKIAGLV